MCDGCFNAICGLFFWGRGVFRASHYSWFFFFLLFCGVNGGLLLLLLLLVKV